MDPMGFDSLCQLGWQTGAEGVFHQVVFSGKNIRLKIESQIMALDLIDLMNLKRDDHLFISGCVN